MPAAPLLRLARATAFATVCAVLGVLAHLVAGGRVSPEMGGWALGLSLLAALPLTGRERGLPVILALLGGVQAATHVVFALDDAVPPGGDIVAHLHCATPGFGMTILHGVAVTLTAIWLARGEAAAWALLRLLGTRLIRLISAWLVPAPVAAAGRTGCFPEVLLLRSALLRAVVSRRGPPVVGSCL